MDCKDVFPAIHQEVLISLEIALAPGSAVRLMKSFVTTRLQNGLILLCGSIGGIDQN